MPSVLQFPLQVPLHLLVVPNQLHFLMNFFGRFATLKSYFVIQSLIEKCALKSTQESQIAQRSSSPAFRRDLFIASLLIQESGFTPHRSLFAKSACSH